VTNFRESYGESQTMLGIRFWSEYSPKGAILT